jgi:hypothetical protein
MVNVDAAGMDSENWIIVADFRRFMAEGRMVIVK